MLNSYWLTLPFILQMLCMAADELYFHKRRGLPRWERIGHPLDTLTVVLCLGWILAVPPSRQAVGVLVGLAVFSCVFVTKDERVHRRHCSAGEHWLHALLFMLHPIVLVSAALLWPAVGRPGRMPWVIRFSGFERVFLIFACALMIGFGIYQFIFWNLLWHRKENAR
jgi:hypothetical protein